MTFPKVNNEVRQTAQKIAQKINDLGLEFGGRIEDVELVLGLEREIKSDFESLKTILEKAGIQPHAEEPDKDLSYYNKYGGPMPGKAITIVTGSWGCHWPLPPGSPSPDHSHDMHTLFIFDREGNLKSVDVYDGADY